MTQLFGPTKARFDELAAFVEMPALPGAPNGNAVLPVPVGGNYLSAHPSHKRELAQAAPLLRTMGGRLIHRGRAGGFVGLTPGHTVALKGQTGPNASNLAFFDPVLGVPADLQPSSTQVYQPLGVVLNATTILFDPQLGVTGADDPQRLFDDFQTGYTNGSKAGAEAKWTELWYPVPAGREFQVGGPFPWTAIPNRLSFQTKLSTDNTRHATTRDDVPAFRDGAAYAILNLGTNNGPYGLLLRTGGSSPATATGLVCQLDEPAGKAKIGAYVNGTFTLIAEKAVIAPYQNNYLFEFAAYGTRIVFKYWLYGSAEPTVPTLEAFSDLVMAPGLAGGFAFCGDRSMQAFGVTRGFGAAPRSAV